MKFTILLLLFLITIEKSTQKRHKRKVAILSNSSEVQNVNVNCHNCRRAVEGIEGFITSVNNASDYFYELIYGWTIEVPLQHDILLTFSWPNEEFSHNEKSTCESCKPYFEIIYGYSSSEETFKIDKFYNIRQLTKLTIPSHKTEIRFFSGAECSESQNLGNAGFAISFKAISLEETSGIYTLLSVLIPAAFIILGVAYFCVIMKKKEENSQNVPSLPIPIYFDLDNPTCEFKKCEVIEKNPKQGRGLRLRTHHSSRLEEPKEITVISSLAEAEVSGSSIRPEDLITPESSNSAAAVETKKQFFKKRLPPKVNLLNRFPRSTSSTPRYASFHNEAYNEDRLSKSDVVIFEKKVANRERGTKIFNFDVLPAKEDAVAQTALETSVFLDSSSASSGDGLPNESIRDLSFVSPK